ncbi:hypothetical protein CEP52_001977 [Fusarium oligoseptatum]|uniref:Uncharacterized protein n=1 Tax=Fusarium oligoseptatum TaxID=2604345 RepID=A0A428UGF9_9HYPO|nr:hypothetical protein CEP52_001977 [Fusarium oligoseptatum]
MDKTEAEGEGVAEGVATNDKDDDGEDERAADAEGTASAGSVAAETEAESVVQSCYIAARQVADDDAAGAQAVAGTPHAPPAVAASLSRAFRVVWVMEREQE